MDVSKEKWNQGNTEQLKLMEDELSDILADFDEKVEKAETIPRKEIKIAGETFFLEEDIFDRISEAGYDPSQLNKIVTSESIYRSNSYSVALPETLCMYCGKNVAHIIGLFRALERAGLPNHKISDIVLGYKDVGLTPEGDLVMSKRVNYNNLCCRIPLVNPTRRPKSSKKLFEDQQKNLADLYGGIYKQSWERALRTKKTLRTDDLLEGYSLIPKATTTPPIIKTYIAKALNEPGVPMPVLAAQTSILSTGRSIIGFLKQSQGFGKTSSQGLTGQWIPTLHSVLMAVRAQAEVSSISTRTDPPMINGGKPISSIMSKRLDLPAPIIRRKVIMPKEGKDVSDTPKVITGESLDIKTEEKKEGAKKVVAKSGAKKVVTKSGEKKEGAKSGEKKEVAKSGAKKAVVTKSGEKKEVAKSGEKKEVAKKAVVTKSGEKKEGEKKVPGKAGSGSKPPLKKTPSAKKTPVVKSSGTKSKIEPVMDIDIDRESGGIIKPKTDSRLDVVTSIDTPVLAVPNQLTSTMANILKYVKKNPSDVENSSHPRIKGEDGNKFYWAI